jgi:hypothetical protein
MNEIIYKWSFQDKKNRWKLWYIIAISVALWLVIRGIFTKQYFFAFIIIILAWVYLFIENNWVDVVDVFVNQTGIKINETFFEYSRIKGFSFVYVWEQLVFLRLFLNNKWIWKLDLKINNEVWENLKQILPNFIKEEKNSELGFFDSLVSFLKL